MAEQPDLTETTAVDGRRARRERGRLAAVNAMIDLILDGHAPPTSEQISERAGVSMASLFRYFETLDELRADAITAYFERFSHLFAIPDIGVGDLDRRIKGLVDARAEQHEATAPIARMVRSRAFDHEELDAALHRLRATQADQIDLHFEEELAALGPAAREDTAATVATLTSFESWDQFRSDHGRTSAQTRRAWADALHRLLRAKGNA